MMSRFKTDLINGNMTEKEWAEILTQQGWSVEFANDKTSEYDLIATKEHLSLTFEIKTDQMAFGTKNVAVELKRTNVDGEDEPSGLSISTADFYIYKIFYKPDFYYIETEELRKIIADGSYREIKGGDDKRTVMALIPLEEFISKCTPIKRTTISEYK